MALPIKGVVGAGHGIHTSGKRTPAGEREWSFNTIVVTAMINEFKNYEGIQIRRADDPTGQRDVPLRERTDMANSWGADFYISYHHNANTGRWGTWTGTETYVYNGAIQSKTKPFAEVIHKAAVEEYQLRDRGLKRANFHILRESRMPAALVEGGYMDSTIDIKVMRNKRILMNVGINIAQAVAKFYGLKRKNGTTTNTNKPVVSVDETLHRVQVGAFKEVSGVAKYAKAVEKKTGFPTYVVEVDGWLKVQIGAFADKGNAEKRLADVKKAGYGDAFITTKGGGAVSVTEPINEPSETQPKPKPAAKGNLEGKKVVLSKSASKYATGETIPSNVKGKTYTVMQDNGGDKVLLKEILSWVYRKDVGGGSGSTAKEKFNLPNETYWVKSPQFSGNGVRTVQEALASIYFYPEKGARNNGIDGYYGAKTADAVRRFQSVHMKASEVDGSYGAKTKDVLDKMVNK